MMDKLQKLIQKRGATVPENLEALVVQYGYKPESLSDADIKAIADQISPVNAMVPKRVELPPKSASNDEFKKALLHAFSQQQHELDSFKGQFLRKRQTWLTGWVAEMKHIVSNTSEDALEILRAELQEEQANAESFSRKADELFAEFGIPQ
jgi:hypothetical protein